ncbi:MAG: hypothetical protein HY349_01085 [Nitrospirae bacterium]|nr:hypothetical protein [Nitrospirota bacterium]
MKNALRKLSIAVLLPILFLETGQAASQTSAVEEKPEKAIVIIAGTRFPKDRLTPRELKAIYLGEINIVENLWIHPVDQRDDQPIRKRFLEKVIQMTRDRYIDHWNQRLFRSGGFTPLLKSDGREVIETVREQDGALGYLWADEARNETGIKILLTLDGP